MNRKLSIISLSLIRLPLISPLEVYKKKSSLDVDPNWYISFILRLRLSAFPFLNFLPWSSAPAPAKRSTVCSVVTVNYSSYLYIIYNCSTFSVLANIFPVRRKEKKKMKTSERSFSSKIKLFLTGQAPIHIIWIGVIWIGVWLVHSPQSGSRLGSTSKSGEATRKVGLGPVSGRSRRVFASGKL